jgi:hypothetical protein
MISKRVHFVQREAECSLGHSVPGSSTEDRPAEPFSRTNNCEAAVALSKETRFRKRSKHIALRWHFIAERQNPQVGDLKVIHRRRTKMLADIFASPRAAPTFIAFRDHILGHKSAFVADDDE